MLATTAQRHGTLSPVVGPLPLLTTSSQRHRASSFVVGPLPMLAPLAQRRGTLSPIEQPPPLVAMTTQQGLVLSRGEVVTLAGPNGAAARGSLFQPLLVTTVQQCDALSSMIGTSSLLALTETQHGTLFLVE